MKTRILWLLAAIAMVSSACNNSLESSGKGRFFLAISEAGFFDTESSKAVNESFYRNTGDYDVVVINASGKEVINCKASELAGTPSKELEMGSYDIVASYGKEADASRDNFYVVGNASIVLKPKDEAKVNITCEPTCGKISVSFSSDMSKYCSDYFITFGGTKALGTKVITYAKGETEPWYVKLDPAGEDVAYTLFLTAKDEYQIRDANGNVKKNAQVAGTFNLLRNKAHKLSIKPNYTPQADGGMGLSITIDDSTVERNVEIEIPVSWL